MYYLAYPMASFVIGVVPMEGCKSFGGRRCRFDSGRHPPNSGTLIRFRFPEFDSLRSSSLFQSPGIRAPSLCVCLTVLEPSTAPAPRLTPSNGS